MLQITNKINFLSLSHTVLIKRNVNVPSLHLFVHFQRYDRKQINVILSLSLWNGEKNNSVSIKIRIVRATVTS